MKVYLPHLETNVTIACQNRCVCCNHFVPLQVHRFKASMIEPAALEEDLRNFGRIAHVEAWGAIGGEPTLHPQIVDLLRIAQRSQVANRIEVWTNGQDLRHLPSDFWQYTDKLIVSAYPGKVSTDELEWLRARCGETATEFELKDEQHHPNFTRLLVPPSSDEAQVQRRYERCWFKTFSRVLDNGYFYRCCTSPFIPPLLLGKSWGFDGLRLDHRTSAEQLQGFLDKPQYMPSCTQCAGRETVEATSVEWHEVADRQEWLVASGGVA